MTVALLIRIEQAVELAKRTHPDVRTTTPRVSYYEALERLFAAVVQLAEEEGFDLPMVGGQTLEQYTADLLRGEGIAPEDALNQWYAETNGAPPFLAPLRAVK
jgi:hypothetical protein